jgi:hypothetical protein
MSADTSQWPMGARPTSGTTDTVVKIDRTLIERSLLLGMLKRVTFSLSSVSLIGGADERRSQLCAEARALIQRVDSK